MHPERTSTLYMLKMLTWWSSSFHWIFLLSDPGWFGSYRDLKWTFAVHAISGVWLVCMIVYYCPILSSCRRKKGDIFRGYTGLISWPFLPALLHVQKKQSSPLEIQAWSWMVWKQETQLLPPREKASSQVLARSSSHGNGGRKKVVINLKRHQKVRC